MLEGVVGLGLRRLGSGDYGWRKECVGVSQQGRQHFKPITAGDLLAVRTLPTRVEPGVTLRVTAIYSVGFNSLPKKVGITGR